VRPPSQVPASLCGAAAAVLALASAASAAPRTYVVDPSGSSVRIHVGRGGALSFAGHKHEVAAPALAGEVVADPENLGGGSVSLVFDAGALVVLPEGEPEGDPPKVQAAMRGPKVLDAARFPSITFRSQRVSGRPAGLAAYLLDVSGQITLHGVTRPLSLPVRVELAGDTLTASGKAVLRHDDFGMKPVSVAGVVKVKNEIGIDYRILARAR
jgi:polyisoprenoid-binding protein YceI